MAGPLRQPTVALLGTGIMGAAMARSIRAAGLPLRVWNRTADKATALAPTGAVPAADPADAVRGVDVVVTMLGDRHQVRAVMHRAGAGLRTGQIWAQMSTLGLEQGELHELADRHGLVFVDAPVAGTRQPAEAGKLLVLAAGPMAARPALEPVFRAVGRATHWLAEDATGMAASRLKLVINSWVVSVTAAIAEAVALADGLDVDPQAFLDAVAGGPLDMPYLRAKAASMADRDWSTNFSVANAAKDADLIAVAGREAGLELDVLTAAGVRYRRTAAAGYGAADLTANYLAGFDPVGRRGR